MISEFSSRNPATPPPIPASALSETMVRSLRDVVYERPISDKEWGNCRDHWMADAEWLRDQANRLNTVRVWRAA